MYSLHLSLPDPTHFQPQSLAQSDLLFPHPRPSVSLIIHSQSVLIKLNMWTFVLASVLLSLLSPHASVVAWRLGKRQDCGSNYSQCSPSGASSTAMPEIGSGLSSLYVDLLHSIKGISAANRRRAINELSVLVKRSTSPNVCCKLIRGMWICWWLTLSNRRRWD